MNPIFFRYGGLAIRYSQLVFLLAFLLSYVLTLRSRDSESGREEREHALFYLVIGGIAGGRLGYILIHWDSFSGRLLESLTLWHGAFTLWGTLIGFRLTLKFSQRFSSVPSLVWSWLFDRLGFTFPLFLALAQWALWFEGEGWGKTGSGWGVITQSGLARYPLWFYFFFGYLELSLILYIWKNPKSRFYRMVTGVSFLQLFLTPLMLFGDLKTFLFHVIAYGTLIVLSVLMEKAAI